MKTKQTLTILLMLLLSFGTWSCEKDEKEKNWTSLPAETQEGKNTIGCLVDGKVWATNMWVEWIYPSMSSVYNIRKKYFVFYAPKKNGDNIEIYVSHPELSKNIKIEKGHLKLIHNKQEKVYEIESSSSNIFLTKIFHDEVTANGIVSGKFSFKAINKHDTSDTIEVEKGRFDIGCTLFDKK